MLRVTPTKRVLFFLGADLLLSLFTLFLAYHLRFNFEIPSAFLEKFFVIFLTIATLKISSLALFKLYSVSWRFFSLNEAKKLLYAHLLAYITFSVLFVLLSDFFNPFARSIIFIDLVLSLLFLGALRIIKRVILESSNDKNMQKTLIVGASSFAQSIIKEKNNFYITAIVDDSPMIVGSYFANLKVHSYDAMEELVQKEAIECVIIAKEFTQQELKELYSRLHKLSIEEIKLVHISQKEAQLKSLQVEDLLARYPKDLDTEKIAEFVKNKKVLITGAGGSIGSELSRQCAKYGAKELILLDYSEYNLYTIAEELGALKPTLVMQSVINKELLDKTFAKFQPDIVLHAAAYKHVPLVEENIAEAIINNILGTKNAIDCAIKHGAKKFVLISTDKAVRPTNVMGTTKRICELYAQNVVSLEMSDRSHTTEIVAVRFGNVLGSSGSVIPKFKAQIAEGGPITVTHPDITRYFMLIPEACELVLQAGALGRGGEIFILDMGEPIKIVDLARKMIELSGRDDIAIEFSGLRSGEKLYEELLIDEAEGSTQYESITVAGKTDYDIVKLNYDIFELLSCEDKLAKLKEMVPEFDHRTH